MTVRNDTVLWDNSSAVKPKKIFSKSCPHMSVSGHIISEWGFS